MKRLRIRDIGLRVELVWMVRKVMQRDVQGLEVTTDSEVAIAAINWFIEQSLIYGKDAEGAILQAVAADPTCVLAHAYAAAYYLSQESSIDRQRAIPFLKSVQQYKPFVTEREQLYTQGIEAWANGQIEDAIAVHEALVKRFPSDVLSVQHGQYHYFYQGNTKGLLQIAQDALPANPNHPYLLGMLAFGLEQCHYFTEAETLGRKATELNRQNPWAHHAVAHVMDTQGRTVEGITWMTAFADTWEACNSMLYTHNWWHVALFYLEQKDVQTVLSLYDTHIWGRARKQMPKDQVGAIALLLRLELQGVDVGTRWQDLSRYLYTRIHEHALPFQDLHYVYALARSCQIGKANEMLVSMVAYAQTLALPLRHRWLSIAVPAARGMIAHATKNWQESVVYLKPVTTQLSKLGGSRAQQRLFEQVYNDASRQVETQNCVSVSIPRHVQYLSQWHIQAS